ncbi:hypothetical protein C8R44DRAFT_809944 [Mycena epipterygia]|nr:hypothetical protein C8R44DRAFT_809944 [Mycena epipterygia]
MTSKLSPHWTNKRSRFPARCIPICFYGALISGVLWLLYPSQSQPLLEAPAVVVDTIAQELGHPTFSGIREYERRLPQHSAPQSWSKGMTQPRYLFLPRASGVSGLNNFFQEQLLNTHLAYLSNRAYVFVDYAPNDHPPIPDTFQNGTRHIPHVPMNAFVSGPTGGGPLSADGESDRLAGRAVSEAWWNVVCSPERVVVVNLDMTMLKLGLDGSSDGAEMMSKWGKHLLRIDAPCVSIDEGSPFDHLFIGSERVLSVWPSYGASPTLKYFAWSSLITGALHHNFGRLSPHTPPSFLRPPWNASPSFRPYHPSEKPFAGLLGIHVLRSDYEQHCVNLAASGAEYTAWNQFGTPGIKARPTFKNAVPKHDAGYIYPALPDYLNVTDGQTRYNAIIAHCWPTLEEIVQRVRSVRQASETGDEFPPQSLRAVYISTDGERDWVAELARLLKADGWEQVFSTFDMDLTPEQRIVEQAVDMSVLTGAETFIGVGFSSFSSNVAQIRLGSGHHPHTIRFW